MMWYVVSDADSTDMLAVEIYEDDMASTRVMDDSVLSSDVLRRAQVGGSPLATTDLPIGAIIGIAVLGSAVLFGLLSALTMYRLRSRHKRKKRPRDLDLSDDDTEEDVLRALRSTRPPEVNMTVTRPEELSQPRARSIPTESDERNKHYGASFEPQQRIPVVTSPTYAFQITGLRDSWPLVGWIQAPAPTLSINKRPVINSADTEKRSSFSAFFVSSENEPVWPQRTVSRAATSTRSNEIKPTGRPGHSSRSSASSAKSLSRSRLSISDNQLTSILRSTSQRLRDAQSRPMSRTMSVLGQVSGAPPILKPPSPPAHLRGESQENLIEADDVSYADSVRSSLLNIMSPSPINLMALDSNTSMYENMGLSQSPTASESSGKDILGPSKPQDILIPVTLAFPRSRQERADQKSWTQISSPFDASTSKQHETNKGSLERGRGGDNSKRPSFDWTPFETDPFVSSSYFHPISPSVHPVARTEREVHREKELTRGAENPIFALRDISGNQQSSTETGLMMVKTPPENKMNPFYWSSESGTSTMVSPSQKPLGVRPKGHKRRRTGHLSRVARPSSISVVHEEPETESNQPQTIETRNIVATHSTGELFSPPRDAIPNEITNTRPPSITTFQPSLKVPPVIGSSDSARSSKESYSATLSFYDYYSSPEAVRRSQDSLELAPSPTSSLKKTRRHGRDFSTSTIKAGSLATKSLSPGVPLENPVAPGIVGFQSPSFPNSVPPQIPGLEPESPFSIGLDRSSRLFGPRALPQPETAGSLTTSVSLLRRMNSQVSSYSMASTISDHSNASPTIPKCRQLQPNPTKRRASGTKNYLNIGMNTASPRFKKQRSREHGAMKLDRDNGAISEEGKDHQDLPAVPQHILELSHKHTSVDLDRMGPKFEPLVPKWPKAPAAQLRSLRGSIATRENCKACKKPLPAPFSVPKLSILASQYHDQCFLCINCKLPPSTAYVIDDVLFCKEHYNQRLNGSDGENGSSSSDKLEMGLEFYRRRPDMMDTSLKQGVRQESQPEMPAAQRLSPRSATKWRGSLGLYDDNGFLKSSPDKHSNMGQSPSPRVIAAS